VKSSPAAERKRLLVLTSTFPRWRGDQEPPFVYELSRRLAKDFDVWVLGPHAPRSLTHENWEGLRIVRFRYFFERFERLANEGGIMANLRNQPLTYLLIPFFMASQLLATIRLLRKERIDLIQAHWIIPQGLLAVLARRFSHSKAAILCTIHGSDLLSLRHPLFKILQRFTISHTDSTTVVSKAIFQHILEIGGASEKVSVLSMGVDAKYLFVPDNAEPRSQHEMLYVGRLTSEKGIELLVKAMPEILSKLPEITLTVIGKGPLELHLRSLCQSLKIAQNVQFVGPVPNDQLPKFFKRATLCVLPSNTEGFGLVCAEALACECPVLASDIPALREIVHHQKTGRLFRKNDIDALVEGVLTMMNDEKLRKQLGHAGRMQILTSHDWEVIANQYHELLHGLKPSGKPTDHLNIESE
jgi:glycosyltransferase involved in cell wall biosynthesis